MKDPILRSLKIKDCNQLDGDAFELVVKHLALFARAGGHINWDFWNRLKSDTKAALVAAFERVRAEDAASIGMASQGRREAARVMSASDGGDLDCELCLDDFADQLDRRHAGRRIS